METTNHNIAKMYRSRNDVSTNVTMKISQRIRTSQTAGFLTLRLIPYKVIPNPIPTTAGIS